MIEESGMRFGEFKEENLFWIEKSEIFQKLGPGIKTVEFILKEDHKIFFLEAKTSCPNENTKGESTEKARKFREYFEDISQKFNDSMQIYLAALLGRLEGLPEIGDSLKKAEDLARCELKFVLVIKNAEIEWLSGPRAVLENNLRSLRRIWNVQILVLNENLAKKYRLIQE